MTFYSNFVLYLDLKKLSLFAKLFHPMNNRLPYIFILLVVFLTSCVPTKDLIYLQNKGTVSKEAVSEVPQKPYRLQVNDVVVISIKSLDPKLVEMFTATTTQSQQAQTFETSYFNGYNINDHGNIRMPILGEVNVLGYTVDEVRVKIENLLLTNYFKKEAEIFVKVKLSGFRYTINGEIKSPGYKILYQDKVSIMEAIANSGDIEVTGNRKDVKVIRQFPQGTETFSIDLTDNAAMNSPVYYLQPNDYIYIQPLKQKTWGTGTTGIQSLGSIITILSLATTTFLLLKK